MLDCIIYGLFDPRNPNEYKYIGQTVNGPERPESYKTCLDDLSNGLVEWILSLRRDNLVPEWRIIHECQPGMLDELEVKTIKEYKEQGHKLLNVMPGGRGKWRHARKIAMPVKSQDEIDKERSAKISAKLRAKWSDPEWRSRRIENQRGPRPVGPDVEWDPKRSTIPKTSR